LTLAAIVASFEAAARARHAMGRIITALTLTVAGCSLLLTALALADAVRSLPEYLRLETEYGAGRISWQAYLMAAQHLNVVLLFVFLYLGLYVLPFIMTLPIAAWIVLLWRDPPRVLVLRPFNRRPLTRGLARLVHSDVGRFGHVYTLADSELRVRWYVRIPVLLGQLALLSFRARTIRSARQLARLERAIGRTWLRNINWCLSWRKVFAVATDDGHWQQVVEALARRASVILIDLTEARTNVLWEIGLIDRLGLGERVIWLVRADSPVTTLEGPGVPRSAAEVHRYDEKGRTGSVALRAAIAVRVAEERGGKLPDLRRGRTLSIAALSMFVTGCLPLLALWSAAMAERLNTTGYDGVSIALLIVVFGVLTGLMLGAAAIRNRNALFLVAVQCVLLTGAVLIGG
jgi:hypothetical protein